MNRRDAHLDAVLRHLGAAYYDSLHGKAAPADVARALDSVAGQVGEEPAGPAAGVAQDGSRASQHKRHGRWHTRVRDVMTVPVVTVDRITPYKEITRRLAEHKVGGVPVLTMGRHVAGVVSEGRLLGIVSRRDLLSVFLRPDADIARQVREIFTDLLPCGAAGLKVAVRNGVVTLTGQPELAADHDLITIAIRLAWDVEGVVDVADKIGAPAVPAAGR